MKSLARVVMLFLACSTSLLTAQTNNIPQVQHVIIVIQENRTPDNLFNEDSTLAARGAHVQPTNNQGLDNCQTPPTSVPVTLSPIDLYTCWDPYHNNRKPYPDWVNMWDNGKMDGACGIYINWKSPCAQPACATVGHQGGTCSYSYVDNTVWNGVSPYDRILHPYFQVAETYGFANFMFQTNQGPSFPAHQFLFSGTSAPVSQGDQYAGQCAQGQQCWKWFDAENDVADPSGCDSVSTNQVYLIDPTWTESFNYTPYGAVNDQGFPCYSHNSLATLLDNAKPNPISWRYYARAKYNNHVSDKGFNIWSAPGAIYDMCLPSGYGQGCSPNSDWAKYVAPYLPDQNNYDSAPILDDIENCNLPAVSWAIPDGNWSDHAGAAGAQGVGDGGPSWIAAIVNAVGNSWTNSSGGHKCDYWGSDRSHASEPTVVLIVWDDWGGWYDDVVPPDCTTNPCTGYLGGNNNGQQYVYGFRVPLLVVSAYANPSYISGANVDPKNLDCKNNNYCHDFGSILNFIEYAFGAGGHRLGYPNYPNGISGDPSWPFADYFAMDYSPNIQNSYSLSDFFNFGGTPQPFTSITGAKYPESCFHNPYATGCFHDTYPADPDDDENE